MMCSMLMNIETPVGFPIPCETASSHMVPELFIPKFSFCCKGNQAPSSHTHLSFNEKGHWSVRLLLSWKTLEFEGYWACSMWSVASRALVFFGHQSQLLDWGTTKLSGQQDTEDLLSLHHNSRLWKKADLRHQDFSVTKTWDESRAS